ncbi:amidohydrolase-domain-containing protein [Multifurca ochricompacta]|uniref:Amidohydrolase-domain-containing protein n=1 Tax=Multifurca ochricompacta TaxID=376703 RepID=A0AAD4QLR5_9AGAM|nr:amidohydrolase-domain-containing protein [Multifurca ochricompacta]
MWDDDRMSIDNHAHPLLTAENRYHVEAEGAALEDAIYTLPHAAARRDLVRLYGLPPHASWEDVKQDRAARLYDELCRMCFREAKIQCILIDDGLGGVKEIAEGYQWHDNYTTSPTRRIVRVEIVAQEILTELVQAFWHAGFEEIDTVEDVLPMFSSSLHKRLSSSAEDPNVAGFKSVVCYRTGLDVATLPNEDAEVGALHDVYRHYRTGINTPLRLAHKPLNDLVVRTTLKIAAMHNKPVQFHTGLGDADITLTRASPAHLQPLIAANPRTTFVLLHASYPYMREAGYLTAVYKNVYLDIGEVFPAVSGRGQEALIRQVLELVPTNKVMWSSDGHWWPETYYLGSYQARQALSVVLQEAVKADELTKDEAARVAKDILFHTANRVYLLGLEAQHVSRE